MKLYRLIQLIRRMMICWEIVIRSRKGATVRWKMRKLIIPNTPRIIQKLLTNLQHLHRICPLRSKLLW